MHISKYLGVPEEHEAFALELSKGDGLSVMCLQGTAAAKSFAVSTLIVAHSAD